MKLENQLDVLWTYAGETASVASLRNSLNYLGRRTKGTYLHLSSPYRGFRHEGEMLKPDALEEERLLYEYEATMQIERFDPLLRSIDGFIDEAAAVYRKRHGLSPDAEVELTEEFIHREMRNWKRRHRQQLNPTVDYRAALDLIVEAIEIRISVYTRLKYTDLLHSAYELVSPFARYPPFPTKRMLERDKDALREYQTRIREDLRMVLTQYLIPSFELFYQRTDELFKHEDMPELSISRERFQTSLAELKKWSIAESKNRKTKKR